MVGGRFDSDLNVPRFTTEQYFSLAFNRLSMDLLSSPHCLSKFLMLQCVCVCQLVSLILLINSVTVVGENSTAMSY